MAFGGIAFASFITGMNIPITVQQLIFSVKQKPVDVLKLTQSILNVIMGLYIAAVVAIDFFLGEQFLLIAHKWTSDIACKCLGLISSFSVASISCAAFTFVTKWFIVTHFTLHAAEIIKKYTLFFSLYWVPPLVMSVCRVTLLQASHFICLHISTKLNNIARVVIVMLFHFIDLAMLVITIILSIFIPVDAWKSGQKAGRAWSCSETQMVVRLVLINLANLVKFLVLTSIIVSELANVGQSSYVFTSLVFFLLPTNAIIDPIIYVVTSKQFQNLFRSDS